MASALIDGLPSATAEFLRRRARRAGAPSAADHVRHELIALAVARAPIDNVVELAAENGSRPLPPALSRRGSVDSDPGLDIDFEADLKAIRYARGLD